MNYKEEEKTEKTKKSKLPIIIIVILSLIIVLMGGYILSQNGILFGTDNAEKNESNKSETKEDNEDKEEDNSEVEEVKDLDLTKCLNVTNTTYQNPTDVVSDYGLSMNIDSDKKSITLTINWEKFGPLSTATAYGGVEKYKIEGFSKEIASTFVGELGQSSMGITLFYLMSDGTIEYTPMFVLKTDNHNNKYYEMNYTYEYDSDGRVTSTHFNTQGSLSEASDIIKLYNVDAYNGPGWRTTIGAKADGSFFDLGAIINN